MQLVLNYKAYVRTVTNLFHCKTRYKSDIVAFHKIKKYLSFVKKSYFF